MPTTIQNAIQMLLFRYPLFEYMNTDGNMRILVFGWNEAAEAFVDSALAAGQMPGHKLQITICTSSPLDHSTEYADKRPALSEYIDVRVDRDALSDSARHYGSLRFCEAKACLDELWQASRSPEVSLIPRYVFIADEHASKTQKLPEALASASSSDALKPFMLIATAQGNRISITQGDHQQFCDDFSPAAGMLSLEDMAFNAHLVWALHANNDIQVEWSRFTDPNNTYNLLSSQSYALSIPYKLWSAGIAFDNPAQAADEFAQKLAHDTDHTLLYQLMDMEQRRWVMEKIAAGYRSSYRRGDYAPFEQFVQNASVKSANAHICIQHSEASAPLESDWYQDNNHQNWDRPNSQDDGLDDLDRMSIDLHRYLKTKADKLRDDRYIDCDPAIRAIGQCVDTAVKQEQKRRAAEGDMLPLVNPLRTEYNRFIFCIRAILDGSAPYAKQYDRYEADFIRVSEAHAPGSLPAIKNNLQKIRHDLFPAIEANQYHNYKQNNRALVQHIPFVLTYKRLQHLAVPFSAAVQRTNINDLIFNNVASPTVIKPGVLLYLYRVEPAVNPDTFDRMLRSCLSFLTKKKIPCIVHLAVSIDSAISDSKRKKWCANLARLKEEPLIGDLAIDETDETETFFLARMKAAHITLYDGTTHLFSSDYKQAKWIERIEEAAGYFEMNPATKQFFATESCRWLKHIYDASFLQIDDMFTLMNCEMQTYEYPDCTEYVCMDENSPEPKALYQCLWEIYTGAAIGQTFKDAVYNWNMMCTVLDPENTCRRSGAGRIDKGTVNFKSLIASDQNKELHLFSGNEIADAARILTAIGNMRSRSRTEEKLLEVTYDNKNRIETIKAKRDSIARILGKAGTILEVYCYYQALATGYFDDIACSCTFYWGDQAFSDSQQKNEIDLILTKGFQSIIAECKATADLTQDYFHKLNTISDLFGINARKALIANTYSSNNRRIQKNQEQINRGDLMDIQTFHEKRDIKAIGDRLINLMKNS